jgi:hypothetical protein
MSTYSPDRWVIVELKMHNSEERHRKVLASWYGGYLGSDSWRISSGITEIVEHADHYEIQNESGSTYLCGKHCVGMSGYTAGILASFVRDLEGKGTIEVVEYAS